MQLARRLRIPALFCALSVLLCELISRPYTTIGVCDDGPYILMAQKLAATGHVAYNGWAAPMLTWQLYLAAAFIKLFGFSFTTVRMSTVLVAMALAFVLQRTLVAANISERNATIGTLAFVLSPLYLMLSATFMTDIHGLFAIVLCLYGCLRALQSSTSRAAIGWLCFAVATNALCGTSRQIAWLGILLMLPSTLWLLRARRRVLLVGAMANLAGALFIFLCIHWLKLQPYSIPEHIFAGHLPVQDTLRQLYHTFLDIPFLLLPVFALFLPPIRRSTPRVIALVSALALIYAALTILDRNLKPDFMLMPTHGDWVDTHGIYEGMMLQGTAPRFLSLSVQVLLTIASIGGFFGLLASFFPAHPIATDASPGVSWKQLGLLLVPFTAAYIVLLIPRATKGDLYDRYLLELLVVALICLVRFYQNRIQSRLPLSAVALTAIMAALGVTVTHNTFALYRARAVLAAELRTNGIPDTSVDNGWEYNLDVELQHAASVNFPTIAVPANAYVPTPPPAAGPCEMFWYDYTPHIHPLYGVSFDPNACYGPAPFAPVHYSRWPYSTPGTLYVVRYTPPAKR
jgi:Dolichyl-phosphate-mannose-protein mannosyltransferase